jgi:hypothetical protein
MADCALRVFIDRFGPKAELDHALPPMYRCIYVAEGLLTISAGGAVGTLSANSAWLHTSPTRLAAGANGAVALRWELVRLPQPDHGIAFSQDVSSEVLADATVALGDPGGYLLRCDKVELPKAGIAYTHTHQGPGIRCLLDGAFNVKVHGKTTVIARHEAWFEAGPDPVYAYAPDDKPAAFARVMVLPRALKGKSSIRYVNKEDADKPKLQRYTIFLDEFIDL